MKKFLTFILALTFTGLVFATDYTVTSVTGKATINGLPVEVGQVFQDEDLLNVGVQSSVELIAGNQHLTIKAMSKGTVKDLWTKAHPSKGRLKKGMIVKASNIAPPSDKVREAPATAASRASPAKEDIDWDE